MTACSSFTCLTKNWRFMNELRSTLIHIVRGKLRVRREPRPVAVQDRARRLVRLLFDENDGSMETRDDAHEQEKLSTWARDLDELCNVFDITAGAGVDDLIHYCWVGRDSQKFRDGVPEGAACCENFEESIEKIIVPFLNRVIHTSWGTTCASRWTYIASTLRRLCLANCCNKLLQTALVQMHIFWNATDGFQATLERMVAADSGDFQARSRLRLLRVVRGLCG